MNKNILEKIAVAAKERVKSAEKSFPLNEIKKTALELSQSTNFTFEKVLCDKDISFICECKKASPSKGIISKDFPYLDIAKEYERAGAAAISVLTEPLWFQGEDRFLSDIAKTVSLPCLRKDFTVDEYMIYEAKILGASAILLICAITDTAQLHNYIKICDTLGISALVEAHDESEINSALKAGARIIGVNNRNLKDFTVDISNSERLRKYVPSDILFIAESGIKTPEDIERLRAANINGVLIGETLMRADNKKALLDKLRGDE